MRIYLGFCMMVLNKHNPRWQDHERSPWADRVFDLLKTGEFDSTAGLLA